MSIFYTDGGTENNGMYGYQKSVICVADEAGKQAIFEEIGDKTNNEAELTAILRCLQFNKNKKKITIISDSQLAVNTILGKWKCKKPHLQALLYQIHLIKKPLYTLVWKPREENRAGWIIESLYGL